MKIDQDVCVGCGLCIPYCPVSAIHKEGDKAQIDLELCVECGTCLEVAVCPVDAVYQQELVYPRTIRAHFSNPSTVCEETGIGGRGTDEVKTNDVKGSVKKGEVAFAVEVGRPSLGASLAEIEKFTKALSRIGVDFEKAGNPLSSLVKNWETGELKDEIKGERVLSIIIEFKINTNKIETVITTLRNLERHTNTVFSVGAFGRIEEDFKIPFKTILENAGVSVRPNSKVNVGLGKPLCPE
jgi:NAD-dependent dihydropyrimidine dehydrogenase PreA subunit